jgi:integrase
MNDHLALLRKLRDASPLDTVPSREALTNHLVARIDMVGDKAFAEFAHLQRVAAETWGTEKTAHFSRVIREARVSIKKPDVCPWEAAARKIVSLPIEWQLPLTEHIAISKKGKAVLGKTIWSVDYAKSVLSALERWVAYCTAVDQPVLPTASALHGYACSLVLETSNRKPTTTNTAANYLQRILAGLAVATRGKSQSEACDFVAADWRERAKVEGASTKTGSQLVGASALYAFGFRLMAAANACPMRGIRTTTLFRNGLILAIGAALPERARALTWLEFDRTLTLIDRTHIHVHLPGEALKYAEARKAREGYDVVFENAGLTEALHAYRADFRPLFDDGLHLFPSVHGKTGAITSGHLGRLTGNLTEKEFGVRIPIHRLRDNVATEASENLIGGPYAAKTLLRHVDDSVTQRHYDHSDGLKAADEFEDFIDGRRTVPAELIL